MGEEAGEGTHIVSAGALRSTSARQHNSQKSAQEPLSHTVSECLSRSTLLSDPPFGSSQPRHENSGPGINAAEKQRHAKHNQMRYPLSPSLGWRLGWEEDVHNFRSGFRLDSPHLVFGPPIRTTRSSYRAVPLSSSCLLSLVLYLRFDQCRLLSPFAASLLTCKILTFVLQRSHLLSLPSPRAAPPLDV